MDLGGSRQQLYEQKPEIGRVRVVDAHKVEDVSFKFYGPKEHHDATDLQLVGARSVLMMALERVDQRTGRSHQPFVD